MRMLKTGLLNFISVLVKVITGLFLNKIMALYVGPAGYALVSQFQNGINFITTFASGAINTGVTKYTAEYANDKGKTSDLFKCITLLAITCCSFFSLTIIVFSEYFSLKLLGTINYSGVIKWFAATLFLFVANSILVSIINGLKEFKLYVLINIFGSLFSLLFSGILIYFFNLKGALIAFATNQSIVFFMTFYLIISKKMVSLKSFIGMPSDFYFIKKLIQYALMAIVSAFCVIYMQIIIRTYIANHFGWVQAGIWDGVWRISSLYLMLVTVPLGVYYLPRLAELHTKSLLLREIKQGYLFLLPI
ncbi:O91 family O-antigen flippase, partial [Escherichia coli]|nr:O91 family O-antigen flippase [Escherichia coli]EGD0220015.1 O91 family O-antigen flippase [Escherichia coli]EIX1258909.1 O91 family O-antigen flippase [Escherichia coli]